MTSSAADPVLSCRRVCGCVINETAVCVSACGELSIITVTLKYICLCVIGLCVSVRLKQTLKHVILG